MTKLRSPHILAMFACLSLALAPVGCAKDEGETDGSNETTGDGDGDASGDGDGDSGSDSMSGDGDGDATDTDPTDSAGDADGDDSATGDGDGDPMGDLPDGASCTSDGECLSGNCYLVPFLGGYCGECNEDADCDGGGCTPPNPFASGGSTCNMGEMGGGCETTDVCQEGLVCGTVLDLLGLIQISTCGECEDDSSCSDGLICAPVVVVQEFSGVATCIEPGSQPQDSFCDLMGSGDAACENVCSPIDIMGLAEIGGCGECLGDEDCPDGTCQLGEFVLEQGQIVGSTCI